jgi:hypothetical protein
MKRSTQDYEAATFIVRLWREPQIPSAPNVPWRGTAVHVQSGTERSLQGMEELLSFLQTWMHVPDPDDND